nr:hypothetical protein BCU66_19970 [Vibrio sp. 10N.286.49.B1]PMH82782.1 hypothetical protein BCU58_16985 [Vibrio sp. 10N.286.48.B7]
MFLHSVNRIGQRLHAKNMILFVGGEELNSYILWGKVWEVCIDEAHRLKKSTKSKANSWLVRGFCA